MYGKIYFSFLDICFHFFRYLIPCRHVMWSQRRHITDVEIYGKNAERFLSLRPSFENKNDKSDRYECNELNNCVEGN